MAKRNQGTPDNFEDMHFPLAGIDLSMGFDRQQPRPVLSGVYSRSTPVGTNVRAFDTLQSRARGGSRPMLSKYIAQQVQGPNLIQELAVVVGVGYTPPGPATAPSPSVVQTGSGASSPGGAAVLADTFLAPVTAGNAVIVVAGSSNFHYPTTLTDGAGNSYSVATQGSVNNVNAIVYYCVNVLGGFTGVTATWASTYGNGLMAFEVAGLAASPVDHATTGGGHNSVGTVANGGLPQFTTTHAADFVVSCCVASTSITAWPGTPWLTAGPSAGNFLVQYQTVGGTGTFYGGGDSLSFAFVNWFETALAAFKGA